MNKLQKGLMAAAVALTCSTGAQAAPVFGGGLNDIEIFNRENIYRTNDACNAVPGSCLAATANDPAGFRRPNPLIGNNVQSGDIFVGVVASRSISNVAQGTVWNEDNVAAGGIDTFTGYFVHRVHSVAINVSGGTDRVLLETSAVDPFGKITAAELAAGVSLKLFSDTGAGTRYQFDGIGVTTTSSIASATDGTLWATLGIGATSGTAAAPALDPDGYLYVETEVSGGLSTFSGTFYEAFNIITEGPAYSAGKLQQINDPDEIHYGGVIPGDPIATAINNFFGVCTPLGVAGFPVPPGYGCYDIPGNGQLTINQNVSPWTFASEDPLQLNQIPEPGSLALVGLALAGLGGIGSRRRKA